MKSNLDKFFKTNKGFEENGVWFEIEEKTRFLVRRFGGNNPVLKKTMSDLYKPYASQIQQGLMSPDKEKELNARAFARACVITWEGVEIDGEEVKYSEDAAVNLFLELPELLSTLVEYASDKANYREEVGN